MDNLDNITQYPMNLQIAIVKKIYYKNYRIKSKQEEIIKYQNWMIQNNINYLEPYRIIKEPKSNFQLY
jgi:hypothetical protein|tara:strand:- start:95 stop:298 length:204 start_codon:yes stop_codon:yes gene_type:complete